jgi:hypothetical protein
LPRHEFLGDIFDAVGDLAEVAGFPGRLLSGFDGVEVGDGRRAGTGVFRLRSGAVRVDQVNKAFVAFHVFVCFKPDYGSGFIWRHHRANRPAVLCCTAQSFDWAGQRTARLPCR